MNTITIQQITYSIESNVYDGDILLLSSKQDVRIVGGYDALERSAISRLQSRTGREELERYEIEYEIEISLHEFILDNFLYGEVTINNIEESAGESALAIFSKERLEKVLSALLERSVARGNDPDLVWFAERIEGALQVKSDPALLPY